VEKKQKKTEPRSARKRPRKEERKKRIE